MNASRKARVRISAVGAVLVGSLMLTACSAEPTEVTVTVTEGGDGATVVNNDTIGDTITIGFSGPLADHGWLGAINIAAIAEAAKYSDINLVIAEGVSDTNVQVSQIETFINDGVDAIVLLPNDGAALTAVAIKAMEAGIPVINVDREFSSPFAARVTILGDNYGMGVATGTYICGELGGQSDVVIAEIAGLDFLQLTQDRSAGFAKALSDCGLSVTHRVAADFTIQGGEATTSQLLASVPKIDAIWNHDDDQGVGVLAAIAAADRDEFFMVGGAGSANAMRHIKDGDTVLVATTIYPSTQAADGIRLARLLVQGKALSDLVEVEVPTRIVLNTPVVTIDNVDQYLPTAFES